MSVPEFKSKNNVGDSDVNVLSNSAPCQQIEDMEAKCLKMQKKAVLQKTSIIQKDRDLVDMSSEIAQLWLLTSVKDRGLEGLASEIAKLSNDLKHA